MQPKARATCVAQMMFVLVRSIDFFGGANRILLTLLQIGHLANGGDKIALAIFAATTIIDIVRCADLLSSTVRDLREQSL